MRTTAGLMGVAMVIGTGCNDVCGSPEVLDGRKFDAFATAREFDLVGDRTVFPAESTPANGPLELSFDWASSLSEGPVDVLIDGQRFEDGTGQWSQLNCGNFTASWSGMYEGLDGAEHTFFAAGYFVYYNARLEGFVDWDEAWEVADGRSGTFSAQLLLRGEELD